MPKDVTAARGHLKRAEDANDAPEALQFVRQATEELLKSSIREYGADVKSSSPFGMVQQLNDLSKRGAEDARQLENLVSVLAGLGNLAVHSPDYVLLTPSARDSALVALRLLFAALGAPIPERGGTSHALPFQTRMSAAAELCAAAALDIIERPEAHSSCIVASVRAYRIAITALGILTGHLPPASPDLDSAGAYGVLRLLRKTPLAHVALTGAQQLRAVDRAWNRGEDLPGADTVRALAYWLESVRAGLTEWAAHSDDEAVRVRGALKDGLLCEPIHVEVLLVAGTTRSHGVLWNGELTYTRKNECWQDTVTRAGRRHWNAGSSARRQVLDAFGICLEYLAPGDAELEHSAPGRPNSPAERAFEALALDIIYAGLLQRVSPSNFRRINSFGEHANRVGVVHGAEAVDAGVCIAALAELLEPQRSMGAVKHVREGDYWDGIGLAGKRLWPGGVTDFFGLLGANFVYNMPLRLSVSHITP